MKLLTNLFIIYMITYGNRLRTWRFFRARKQAELRSCESAHEARSNTQIYPGVMQ